ncbi:PrgH/EprH family type III secretion apparatus protein [Escherichia coli]|uniref:PrgH/EprH family type III secretion apparatus protein n=1 Tax=Escherichia coli TaxID=562 RepID=UPI00058A4DD2|nr:PrgH/EprH family type III secretion apparatus protein [Escherichia coli]KIH21241.1 hypothetical protein PU13_20000 [Escherichia coli]SQL82800.1 Type III secretion EprH protein [Escherichia coli]SQS25479.1 Type III secretion EprH protein [Escherichia coli]
MGGAGAKLTEHTMNTDRNVILRFLNGRLAGCEFSLNEEKNLIILGSSRELDDSIDMTTLPENVIFVPTRETSYNVEILISDMNDVIVRELLPDGARESTLTFNEIFRSGEAAFSLKEGNQEWETSVLNYTETVRHEITDSEKNQSHLFGLGKKYLWVACAFIVLLLSFLLIWSGEEKEEHIESLKAIIKNNQSHYQIVPGENDIIYVWSRTTKDTEWLNEQLKNETLKNDVKILTSETETRKLEKWFSENYRNIALYRIRHESPGLFEVWLSKQRSVINEIDVKELQAKVKNIFPYVKNMEVVDIDDQEVISDAENGLKRLGLDFSQDITSSYVAYHIYGDIDDSQLVKINRFIDSFYSRWGEGFVAFNISLSTDNGSGQSYGYGKNSFIKTGPDAWKFK